MASRGHRRGFKVARRPREHIRIWPLLWAGFGSLPCFITPALALAGTPQGTSVAAQTALVAGLTIFSGLVAALHLTQRRRWMIEAASHHRELTALRCKLDRYGILLGAEHQVIAVWADPGEEPDIEGDLELAGDRASARACWRSAAGCRCRAGTNRRKILGPRLRAVGQSFRLTDTSLDGRHLEIEGRPDRRGRRSANPGHIRRSPRDRPSSRSTGADARAPVEALRTLLDATPYPAWLRDGDGKLSWVNAAYAARGRSQGPGNCGLPRHRAHRKPRARSHRRLAGGGGPSGVDARPLSLLVSAECSKLSIPGRIWFSRNGRRCIRNRNTPGRDRPTSTCACAHTRPAFDGSCHLRWFKAIGFSQCGLSPALGSRSSVARSETKRFGNSGPPAGSSAFARAGGFPRLERRPACRLSIARYRRASLVFA